MGGVGPTKRCIALNTLLNRLGERASSLAAIITRENGKTLPESRGEINAALADGAHLLTEARTAMRRRTSSREGIHCELLHEPVGVYLLITPWNFPLATIVRKLIPALALGNTVVLKPSELTPGPAVQLMRLMEGLLLPPGTVNLVLGTGKSVGPTLVDHSALRGISFTGSNTVGLALARQTAGRDVRLQLEMGGKNSLVVLADADLDQAVEAAMLGGFSCAGQWCTGTGRVIVEDSVYSSFCDTLMRRTSRLAVGPGDLKRTAGRSGHRGGPGSLRPVHRPAGIADGAILACGGDRPRLPKGQAGHFFRPTVLTEVNEDAVVFTEELFVPILPVIRAADAADALRLANLGRMGLSASIFTSNPRKADRFIRGVEAGIVHHNLHTAHRVPELPVSAWRESGRGIPECGDYASSFFARPRAVYLNP